MRLKKQYLAAAVTLGIMNWTTYSEAAFDENLNEYTLDAVVVEGMDTTAFTDKHFFVLDWNLNYEINDDTTAYVTITNLTNEAYENAYSAYNGIGAAPQPGRCYMVGMRYKF